MDYSRSGEPSRYDIPKAHIDADESASEVVPNEAGRGDGSTKTQDLGKQPVESTGENQDTAGSGSGAPANVGQAKPTSQAAPQAGEEGASCSSA